MTTGNILKYVYVAFLAEFETFFSLMSRKVRLFPPSI